MVTKYNWSFNVIVQVEIVFMQNKMTWFLPLWFKSKFLTFVMKQATYQQLSTFVMTSTTKSNYYFIYRHVSYYYHKKINLFVTVGIETKVPQSQNDRFFMYEYSGYIFYHLNGPKQTLHNPNVTFWNCCKYKFVSMLFFFRPDWWICI